MTPDNYVKYASNRIAAIRGDLVERADTKHDLAALVGLLMAETIVVAREVLGQTKTAEMLYRHADRLAAPAANRPAP